MSMKIKFGITLGLVFSLFTTVCASASAEYVTLMPDVTAPMMSSDFWLNKIDNPHKLIMRPSQIEQFNKAGFKNVKWLNRLENWDENTIKLREKMDIPLPEGEFFIDDLMVTDTYWGKLSDNLNLDGINDEGNLRYGFITNRTNVKRYPTNDVITNVNGDIEYDEFQETAAFTGEPVVILHESLDGRFYYCALSYYLGWINKNDIAFCETKEDWLEAQSYTDFLLITGNMITLGENPFNPALSKVELYMGTKLPLVPVPEQPETLYGRQVLGNYVVKFPVRDKDGYVKYEYLPIPVSKDVSIGYLPYTYANVLEQLFKMQGDRYGWGGMLGARDSSGLSQEMYRCFGIYLPRNSGQQVEYTGKKFDLTEKSVEERDTILTAEVKPGAILGFPGHIMIYLGEHEGKHYVMSATGGYGEYYDESTDAYSYSQTRSVYINSLDIKRASGTSWLESLTSVVCLIP